MHPKHEQNRSSTLGPRHLNPMDILRNVLPQELLRVSSKIKFGGMIM